MSGKTGNFVHDTICNLAEGLKQTSIAAAGNNQVAVNAAMVTFYRSVVSSSRANNNSSDIATALFALRSLGVAQ
jgi:hypothetical protein